MTKLFLSLVVMVVLFSGAILSIPGFIVFVVCSIPLMKGGD